MVRHKEAVRSHQDAGPSAVQPKAQTLLGGRASPTSREAFVKRHPPCPAPAQGQCLGWGLPTHGRDTLGFQILLHRHLFLCSLKTK